jgi:hypothetical protein
LVYRYVRILSIGGHSHEFLHFHVAHPHPFLFVVSDLLYSIVWVLCPATLANAHSP